MATHDELAHATAAELAGRIRRRELSPVEVIDAAIGRIESENERLNAFVHLDLDQARERARRAESAVGSGAALGPLHGVPTAMKDLFDFKPGWPTTFGGVRALKDFVPDFYCAWAERMERAGAIIVGKTNSPVMGFRGTCDTPLLGPSRNPFDPSRNTGGSSGGSAGAVAAGLVPVAEGTDGGGSIRIPASWCGVYGYKQSFGRVPYIARPNAFTGLNPFLFEGPLTRTVEDAALVVDAIAGYDPRDPFALDEPANLSGAVGRSINGWRIAYSPDFDVFPVDRRGAEVGGEARHRAGPARAERPLVQAHHPDQRRVLREHEGAGTGPSRRAPRRLPAGVPALDRRGLPSDRAPVGTRPADAERDLRRDPGRLRELRPAGHAHSRLPGRREQRRRKHQGADRDQRSRGGPADRVVPDLLHQLLGPPGRIDPGRDGRGKAAGGDADHRQALRRRRRVGGERGVRARPAVAGDVSDGVCAAG